MSSLWLSKFLQIEEEILRELSLEKYQIKYLFHTLYEKKPQYELVRFLKKEEPCKAEKDTKNKGKKYNNKIVLESKDICIQIEVYDKIEKRNKYLQIFLLESSNGTTLESLQEKVKRVNDIGQIDLVLNPIDSYILKSELSVLFTKDTIFVIEYEMFDMTLRHFCKSFKIDSNSIAELLSQQCTYCQDISYIQMQGTGLSFSIEKFYVKIENPQKIKFLLNLIHLDTTIYSFPHQKRFNNKEKKEQEKEKQMDMIDENKVDQNQMIAENNQLDINKILDFKTSEIREYSLNLKKTKFKEVIKDMKIQVSQNELTKQLSICLPNHSNKHSPEIFEIISQQPKYSNFEVLTIDNHIFKFKVIKKDKAICFLEGIKCKSFNEAEELQKWYQQLINSTSPTKKITNITSVELFMLSKETYILKEQKDRISFFQSTQSNLGYQVMFALDNKNAQNKKEERDISIRNTILLVEFIELCYTLITKGQISIHTINPENIDVKQWAENVNGQYETQLLIDHLQAGETFIAEYYQLFELMIERSYYFSAIKHYVFDIVDSFFQAMTLSNQAQAKTIYNMIKGMFKRLILIIELEDKLLKELESGFIKIWFADQFLERINIEINNPKRQDVEVCQKVILKDHQFNFIDLNFNVKRLYSLDFSFNHRFNVQQYRANQVQYEENEKIVNKHLGKQNKDALYQFFSQKEYREQRQRMVNALTSLTTNKSKEKFIELKEYRVNYDQLILMWSDEEEFQFEASDKMIDVNQCLELTIKFRGTDYKIKFIKTMQRVIAIVRDSPRVLIGAYQRYMNDIGIMLLLKQAALYQSLENTFQDEFQINHCCEFKEQFDIQLLLCENQKQLQGIKISLEIGTYRCCERIHSLLNKHKQLKYLSITFEQTRRIGQDLNQLVEKEKKFSTNLRKQLLPFKHLNYLQLDSRKTPFDEKLFKCEMHKLIRLVRIDINYSP